MKIQSIKARREDGSGYSEIRVLGEHIIHTENREWVRGQGFVRRPLADDEIREVIEHGEEQEMLGNWLEVSHLLLLNIEQLATVHGTQLPSYMSSKEEYALKEHIRNLVQERRSSRVPHELPLIRDPYDRVSSELKLKDAGELIETLNFYGRWRTPVDYEVRGNKVVYWLPEGATVTREGVFHMGLETRYFTHQGISVKEQAHEDTTNTR